VAGLEPGPLARMIRALLCSLHADR
jgi:hypothetical protein